MNALRGTSFATAPNAPLDREAVRAFFSTPTTRLAGQLNASRRSNRRFVHVKLDVDDIRGSAEAAPFAWSTYDFKRDGDLYVYRQTIGPAAGKDVGDVGWTGRELVAFRLHLPSKIRYHNNGRGVDRGNILVWEQPLDQRLRGHAARARCPHGPAVDSVSHAVAVRLDVRGRRDHLRLVIWWIVRRAPAEKRAA